MAKGFTNKYTVLYNKLLDPNDKLSVIMNAREEDDKETVLFLSNKLRKETAKTINAKKIARERRDTAYEVYKKTFLMTSHYVFEDFMIYLEINRPLREQFYRPRMKKLKPIVQCLQDLHDGKLDELFLSCPPRVGKTTVIDFFGSWEMGLNSENTNLYVSHSDTLVHDSSRG